jgi:hypothetical protein
MSTNGAYPDEMNDATLFADALRATVPTQPEPGFRAALIPRLAATARASAVEAETVAVPATAPTARPTRPRSRWALFARVGVAVALIPLVLAGLAFAGVIVPSPARDAFDTVGITLPNQPAQRSQSQKPETTKSSEPSAGEGGANDVSSAAQTKPNDQGGNSKAAHEHARKQHQKAQGKATGHGRGKAVGLNDTTPPGHSGQTGPPANSNAGGSSSSHSSGKPARPAHTPNGVANGQTKLPPGHSK